MVLFEKFGDKAFMFVFLYLQIDAETWDSKWTRKKPNLYVSAGDWEFCCFGCLKFLQV